MPIGGFIVNTRPEDTTDIVEFLKKFDEIEVYTYDDRGNIVVVIETELSDQMDQLVDRIKQDERVLSVTVAYLYYEDEVEKIEKGEYIPERFRQKRRNK